MGGTMEKVFGSKMTAIILVFMLLVGLTGCADKTAPGGAMSSFSAQIIGSDETFTEKDLADYDLTVVNVWTTWCGYCIYEMPGLQALYENLPDNINFISICADADVEYETAKEILEEIGCTFTTIVPGDDLRVSLLMQVQGYPTTFFIDSEGNAVGKPHVGLPTVNGNIAGAYMAIVEERLAMLK